MDNRNEAKANPSNIKASGTVTRSYIQIDRAQYHLPDFACIPFNNISPDGMKVIANSFRSEWDQWVKKFGNNSRFNLHFDGTILNGNSGPREVDTSFNSIDSYIQFIENGFQTPPPPKVDLTVIHTRSIKLPGKVPVYDRKPNMNINTLVTHFDMIEKEFNADVKEYKNQNCEISLNIELKGSVETTGNEGLTASKQINESFASLEAYEQFVANGFNRGPARSPLTLQEEKYQKEIYQVYHQLLDLTNKYLEEHKKLPASSSLIKKQKLFNELKTALTEAEEDPREISKFKRIEKFIGLLNNYILHLHRTAPGKRFIANVLSILTLIPALARMLHSYLKFGTVQFWKPESERIKFFALDKQKALKAQAASLSAASRLFSQPSSTPQPVFIQMGDEAEAEASIINENLRKQFPLYTRALFQNRGDAVEDSKKMPSDNQTSQVFLFCIPQPHRGMRVGIIESAVKKLKEQYPNKPVSLFILHKTERPSGGGEGLVVTDLQSDAELKKLIHGNSIHHLNIDMTGLIRGIPQAGSIVAGPDEDGINAANLQALRDSGLNNYLSAAAHNRLTCGIQ